jgi:hypothetical protein
LLAFFRKILIRFSSPRTRKRLLLREELDKIAHQIARTPFRRYYKSAHKSFGLETGQLFQGLARVFAPAAQVLAKAEDSPLLRGITIEKMLTQEQKAALDKLDMDTLRKTIDGNALLEAAASIEKLIAETEILFTKQWTARCDAYYNQVIYYIWLATLNYPSIIRPFIPAGGASTEYDILRFRGSFHTVPGAAIIAFIQDFAELLEGFEIGADWDTVFDILAAFSKNAPPQQKKWGWVKKTLEELDISNFLHLLLRHYYGKANLKITEQYPQYQIATSFVTGKLEAAQTFADNLRKRDNDTKVNTLRSALFGEMGGMEMAGYYTREHGESLAHRCGTGFTCADAFNTVRLFITVFYDEITLLCDTLIISGEWYDMDLYRNFAANWHHLEEILDNVKEFDKSLGPDGQLGKNEASAKLSKVALTIYVEKANEAARALIEEYLDGITILEQQLETIYTDKAQETPLVIRNWEPLDTVMAGTSAAALQKAMNDFEFLETFLLPE